MKRGFDGGLIGRLGIDILKISSYLSGGWVFGFILIFIINSTFLGTGFQQFRNNGLCMLTPCRYQNRKRVSNSVNFDLQIDPLSGMSCEQEFSLPARVLMSKRM